MNEWKKQMMYHLLHLKALKGGLDVKNQAQFSWNIFFKSNKIILWTPKLSPTAQKLYLYPFFLFQGLYYSYFKTVIEAEGTLTGLKGLYANNLTEFPDTINVIRRFNVYPELFVGLIYRFAESRKLISKHPCWTINRGEDRDHSYITLVLVGGRGWVGQKMPIFAYS